MTKTQLLASTAIGRAMRVNDAGYRIGEGHHNARLTDQEVEEIRDLHEHGIFSYAELMALYDSGKTTIADICNYRRRNHAPAVGEKVTRRR